MNSLQIKNIESIRRNSNIHAGILKSFDNILLQQDKMDNKAFIFIGFLSVILGIINKSQIINSPVNWILSLSIILLACSILPIASRLNTEILKLIIKKNSNNTSSKYNIFYYLDIFDIDIDLFTIILKEQYKMDYINPFEIKLMEQILINSKILKLKIFWHNAAYTTFFLGLILYALINVICKLFLT